MGETTIQLVGANFPGEEDAEATMEALRTSSVRMYNAVIFRTDAKGKVHVHQIHHLSESGDSWGGIIAASAGVFAGLLMVPAAVGTALAAAGAVLIAEQRGAGDLRELVNSVGPCSSTLLVTCPPHEEAAIMAELRPRATRVHSQEVTEETVGKLAGARRLVEEALAQAEDGVHPIAAYYGTTRY
jgi:uncharacterized membrane protein